MAWTPTTWDAATKEFTAYLSGGDLVYSTDNYYANTVTSVASAVAGRWYWETTLDVFVPGAAGRFGAITNGVENGLGRDWQLGSPVQGDVLGFALDIGAGAIEFFKNGASVRLATGLEANPGETWKAYLQLTSPPGSGETVSATTNFGASAFAFPVPTGFNAGFGEETPFFGDASALTMLGIASGFALQQAGIASAPSPMGAVRVRALHDFTGALGDATTRYVMDLITPGGTVRTPISSWQATLQTGSSNYVQCVVPACAAHVAQINSATEFVIYRRAELPDGSALEYEMARAPTGQVRFDWGPQRHTCTLAGYSTAFVADENPPVAYNRALVAVRSISSGQGGMRVRCAVDWLLRPGHRAFADGAPLVVSYINYYAPSGGDGYMDVGERT